MSPLSMKWTNDEHEPWNPIPWFEVHLQTTSKVKTSSNTIQIIPPSIKQSRTSSSSERTRSLACLTDQTSFRLKSITFDEKKWKWQWTSPSTPVNAPDWIYAGSMCAKHIIDNMKNTYTLVWCGNDDSNDACTKWFQGFVLTFDAHIRDNSIFRDNILARKNVKCLDIFVITSKQLQKCLEEEWIWADCTVWARALQNAPRNYASPAFYLKWIRRMVGKSSDKVSIRVKTLTQMRKEKWGVLPAFERGDKERDPIWIEIAYKGTTGPATVLLGKGVTFDSGGSSLKRSEKMRMMKMDDTGAILAVCTLWGMARTKQDKHLLVATPWFENVMTNGKSLMPGDVVHTIKNTTIEVTDVDAEGRIALAEGSEYLRKRYHGKMSEIVLLATMTGLIDRVSMGAFHGLFVDPVQNMDKWCNACTKSGEHVWMFPLMHRMVEMMRSTVADWMNWNESVKSDLLYAALFLRQFWDEKEGGWSYLDLSGSMDTDIQGELWNPREGRGVGVQLLREYLL